MKRFLLLALLPVAITSSAQTLGKLTVEKIMRDPKWMGTSPDSIRWSDDSKKVYFKWNPENLPLASLYSVSTAHPVPMKVSDGEQTESAQQLRASGSQPTNKKQTQKLLEKNGDLFLVDIATGRQRQLTNTVEQENSPKFSLDETRVYFNRGDNVFSLGLASGELIQLSNFTRPGAVVQGGQNAGRGQNPMNSQETWLKTEQLSLFDVLKERKQEADDALAEHKRLAFANSRHPREISTGGRQLSGVAIADDGRYITYRLTRMAETGKVTVVPNYVTASGFTEEISNRTKVGAPLATAETWIYDTQRDTNYIVGTRGLPGIKDLPDYVKDYPNQLEERTAANADRPVSVGSISWSPDAKLAAVIITSLDNKDRWIMRLDPSDGHLSLIDRQRDEAWIGGPGISSANLGWVDETHLYFQSEASGYSHIYVADVLAGTKKQLTSGKWEVQALRLSADKKNFYFTANIEHPGITHFYKIPAGGGEPVKITSTKGGNVVSLSPDEKWLAIRYSYSNKPWELYLQENRPGAKAIQVTASTTEEFRSYSWRDPEMITFKNRYGTDIYARLYRPASPDPAKPAVVFVHGAGYLQNVHYWWSDYYHEYLFNNLLADNGYTVLDIDYTGSSGYGRDFRTGIYRHMGGKDLTDQVDGVKLLVEKYGVDPKHIGLYGGSYGGFITLMALFTEPGVFAAGAALRSVTDWAHYNHGYTSNILNEPYNDERAYQLSSPINFAAGLKGRLLMCHGMIDQNVNFQDIIRLSQRLIELHKENWELAVFPLEDHGFTEPSSWTDEYKRVFKLFEETLKK